jgi:hypothetical protein
MCTCTCMFCMQKCTMRYTDQVSRRLLDGEGRGAGRSALQGLRRWEAESLRERVVMGGFLAGPLLYVQAGRAQVIPARGVGEELNHGAFAAVCGDTAKKRLAMTQYEATSKNLPSASWNLYPKLSPLEKHRFTASPYMLEGSLHVVSAATEPTCRAW